jgi:hypothetical protein
LLRNIEVAGFARRFQIRVAYDYTGVLENHSPGPRERDVLVLLKDGGEIGSYREGNWLYRTLMSKLLLGTICGIIYGGLSAVSMIPLAFADKKAALIGAFLNRFAIGFVIGAAKLPVPGWLQGLIFGILLSLPDAIITKAFTPILVLGAVGGLIIGVIMGRWGI